MMLEFYLLIGLLFLVGGVFFVLYMRESGKLAQIHQALQTQITDQERTRSQHEQLQMLYTTAEQKLVEVSTSMTGIRTERDQLSEKGKINFARMTQMNAELQTLRNERQETKAELAQKTEKLTQMEKTLPQQLEQMHGSKTAFEREQKRIQALRETETTAALANKQRLWSEHETIANAHLRTIIQDPQVGMIGHENTTAPEVFGRRKPDFCVGFLDRYIVFDAKTATAARDMNTYLNEQAKSTAKKYEAAEHVYPTVYFVVPSDQLQALKKTHWYEGGYDFYAISKEACGPILKAYRRVLDYDRLTEYDPAERDAIVDIIARYDRYMSYRNAVDVVMARDSIRLMQEKETLLPELSEAISIHKSKMGLPRTNKKDIEVLAKDLDRQKVAIKNLTKPQIPVDENDLQQAEKLF